MIDMGLTAEVQISTLGKAGLERVAKMVLPPVDGITYRISVQNPTDESLVIPSELKRPDVELSLYRDRGVSRNRNHGLDAATADIVFISDDDLRYDRTGLLAVIDYFEKHPDVDFVTFRSSGSDGKLFPDEGFEFGGRRPRGYYLSAFEMALRRDRLPAGLRYSTDFEISSPVLGCGEESIFLVDLERAGLRGHYVPVTVVEHPDLTTGSRPATAPVLRAQGAYLRYRYGSLKGFLKILRDVPRRKASPWHALIGMMQGYFYLPRIRH